MPRGRHRHSPPLHRLLPPSAIAGVSVACAAGAWLFTEPTLLRGLVAAAAVPTLVGAVVMRRWDRVAGRRVAELERARKGDEWRYEERTAELESDLEESREVRTRIEQKLRAKRTELAALRNEHAALLRRYATAETERASALEGRRRLAIEASVPARALTAAPVVTPPTGSTLFREANAALDRLARGGRPGAARGERTGGALHGTVNRPGAKGDGFSAFGNAPLTPAPAPRIPGQGAGPKEGEARGNAGAAGEHTRTAAAPRHFTVPAAAAVPASARRAVPQGGFDFFGTKHAAPSSAALEAAQNSDLADVVGEEALAVHKAESESRYRPAGLREQAVGQVIDLTAHDDTEPIDMTELRSAVS
ncbi:hypothetical protein [Streptomyces physcomitrii]|uniref:Secreted protein n=1 Tax=Streptomyces physcomitrii TaxID=2724184 RepID=A0ABX1H8C2_9ACTN|nr:hypothetical protein [Streptomyces physcomitrii]NKI44608.1 hypothetical protein [Streptomyces physcomitrii]